MAMDTTVSISIGDNEILTYTNGPHVFLKPDTKNAWIHMMQQMSIDR